jgi:hypothetical protein
MFIPMPDQNVDPNVLLQVLLEIEANGAGKWIIAPVIDQSGPDGIVNQIIGKMNLFTGARNALI